MSKRKDPAFLFYSDNFMSGTMFLSDEQVGKYVRLLCAQHLNGHLEYEDMIKICKTHDKHIFLKFKQDEQGKYYNERLDIEVLKRKAYSDSRSKNREKKSTYVPHMENEDMYLNKTEDKNKIPKDGTPLDEITPEQFLAIKKIPVPNRTEYQRDVMLDLSRTKYFHLC